MAISRALSVPFKLMTIASMVLMLFPVDEPDETVGMNV